MTEEYSYRPEFELRDEFPAPPEEYGSQGKGVKKSKKKKLAQLMMYSWIMLMIGGGAAALTAGEAQCAVTVYDGSGNVVLEQTLSEAELDSLELANGVYLVSSEADGFSEDMQVTDGVFCADSADKITFSDDGLKHIDITLKTE